MAKKLISPWLDSYQTPDTNVIIDSYRFAGGGGPFSPSDIAGLKLWLKADALSLSNNDPVASWTDSSGSGNDATQPSSSLRPLFKTSILNSLPIVRFDGSDDFLVTGGTSYAVQSFFIVFYYGGKTSYDGVVTARPSSTIGGVGNSDGNYGCTLQALSANKVCSTDSVPVGGSGAHSFVGVDGVSLTVADFDNYNTGITVTQSTWHVLDFIRTSTSAAGAKYLTLGTDSAVSSRYLNGDIAEVIVYDSDIGMTNREKVEDYLGTKYGITITH